MKTLGFSVDVDCTGLPRIRQPHRVITPSGAVWDRDAWEHLQEVLAAPVATIPVAAIPVATIPTTPRRRKNV